MPTPHAPRTQHGSGNKISTNLLALSSAAVLAVYTAGYLRTSAAASRLEASSSQRRTAAPMHAPAERSAAPAPLPTAELQAPGVVVPQSLPAGDAAAVSGSQADRRNHDERAKVVASPAAIGAPASGGLSPASSIPPSAAPVESAAPEPLPSAAPVAVDHPVPEAAAAPPAAALPAAKYKDGTYLGWGTSRHGDIQASVVIEGGRIVSATIAQCLTRYSCSWIADLPPQVIKRQSPEVDFVSGATQSTNAFYYGIVEALAKAK
jgi:uncharacterized protein with FMN-binding domain